MGEDLNWRNFFKWERDRDIKGGLEIEEEKENLDGRKREENLTDFKEKGVRLVRRGRILKICCIIYYVIFFSYFIKF